MIEWERAGDDQLAWRRQGSSEPATPLDESHAPYYMQSWSHVYRRQGTPETVRYRHVDGRRYVSWRGGTRAAPRRAAGEFLGRVLGLPRGVRPAAARGGRTGWPDLARGSRPGDRAAA